jgi:hypothetical protein
MKRASELFSWDNRIAVFETLCHSALAKADDIARSAAGR